MEFTQIGKSVERWDAVAKVTGKANYTGDIPQKELLYGKICRGTIAHGLVKSIDASEALKVPGVVKILTPDDVSQYKFPTAGHPYNLDPKLSDKADRNILTKRIRLYGDEIAAVIAENELAAEIAVSKIKVEYEEWPFYLTTEEALAEGALEIHEGTKNLIASNVVEYGNLESGYKDAAYVIEGEYATQIVQHCQLENQVAYAYKDVDGRWTCVSSTQIPHICRRILGQAFNMPWGRFRVIKPFIGGGFGNKQDVTIEPLVVAMSMAVGGKAVMLDLTREEEMAWTRVRHAIRYRMKMGLTKEGKITAIDIDAVSNNGAYASHGHAVVAKGSGIVPGIYEVPNFRYAAKTVYTNTAAAGAFRGYGVPQISYALEAHMDKVSREIGIDPFELRRINKTGAGDMNPVLHMVSHSNGLEECLEKGRKAFRWDERKAAINNKPGSEFIRGLGLASFIYTSGTYPKGLEAAGCRLVLNQDGSVKMMVGATEIGQGSDTVFSQMVADTLGISYDRVYADKVTDTDTAPFDTGAYASRQSFVSGMAVRKAAEELKEKILQAAYLFNQSGNQLRPAEMDIVDNNIVARHNGQVIESLGDLALKTYYDLNRGECLTADVSNKCLNNAYPFGVTLTEVEIDTKTGKIEVIDIMNVHDSGIILNPLLAQGQVEGGMAIAIAYALGEELKYDGKTGKPLNNNLLDYKMPTFMDVPTLGVEFVEIPDPNGPYGNKSLGEPPTCSPAPALRNAIVDALGVEISAIPITPQKVIEVLQGKVKGEM